MSVCSFILSRCAVVSLAEKRKQLRNHKILNYFDILYDVVRETVSIPKL